MKTLHGTRFWRGFTLIELLVVLSIVSLLLTLAVPRYFQSIDAARDAVLVDNLRTTREMLDKFYGDTGRYPDSLEELVEKKYLKSLPFDPVRASSSAWVLEPPQEGTKGKVYDLRSSAPGNNHLGVAYGAL
jgi:general secretion pathway protein G